MTPQATLLGLVAPRDGKRDAFALHAFASDGRHDVRLTRIKSFAERFATDARRAVLALRQSGIDVFGVALDPRGAGCATAIFGRANTLSMRELAELPARLAGLYFSLRHR